MKKNINIYIALVIMFVFVLALTRLFAQISNTKHNLSSSGSGSVKATAETEICLFCHTPHNSARTPLWNRSDPTSTYTLYNSSTLDATLGQPDGNSILCLSCHDGTVALGSVRSRTSTISFGANTYLPDGTTNLSTDLSDDHPISFTYSSALATSDGQLLSPNNLASGIKLQDNKVQCTSCHDPHKNTNSDFLVVTTQASALCVGCHSITNWSSSTHYSSTRTWNGSSPDPWFHTPSSYTTVQSNGCENCHNIHNAGRKKMLLNFASSDEANCLSCHNGNVATKNIQTEINKTYNHKVGNYSTVHDPTEANLVATQHVECIDCHNPHQSNATSASAPNVNGFLKGVKGIDTDGNSVNPAVYEYQICYRCHSSSSWRPSARTSRQIVQNNVRLEYDSGNPSYHPIEAAGTNSSMRSLLTGWSTTSIMYCSDCHASNGTNAPAGPHGSTYAPILKKLYTTADPTTTGSQTAMESNFALCFDCHSSARIWDENNTTASWRYHRKHIQEEDTPCNTCHDPHGVETGGSGTGSHTHLINFRTGIVTADQLGRLRFEDQGTRRGRCYLTCHDQDHSPKSY